MIRFSINSQQAIRGFEELVEALVDLEYRVFNLQPLAVRVIDVLQQDNTEARLAGVDWRGEALAPLSDETWRRHPNRGSGPPLAGKGVGSRSVSDLTFQTEDVAPGVTNVLGTWPNMPFLWVHVTGRPNMPSRDPVGIREEARLKLAAMLETFLPEHLFGSGGVV